MKTKQSFRQKALAKLAARRARRNTERVAKHLGLVSDPAARAADAVMRDDPSVEIASEVLLTEDLVALVKEDVGEALRFVPNVKFTIVLEDDPGSPIILEVSAGLTFDDVYQILTRRIAVERSTHGC